MVKAPVGLKKRLSYPKPHEPQNSKSKTPTETLINLDLYPFQEAFIDPPVPSNIPQIPTIKGH